MYSTPQLKFNHFVEKLVKQLSTWVIVECDDGNTAFYKQAQAHTK